MLLNRSRGEIGGKPFAQHCSCPAVLRCSVGSTMAAFRELLSYGRIAYSDTFILHSGNASTNVALVARPCAPAAQRADESSSSRSRLAKSYGRFAPLSLKQDCFFRVSSSKIKIFLPGPPTADSVMIFLPDTLSSRLRSDSFQKFAPASQTLEFEKQSSLRVYRFSETRCIIKS